MTQAITHYTIADFARFRAAFDADTENRGNAGMTLLQLWRESATSAWALFQVSDASAARTYLDGNAAVFNSQAGVSAVAWHMVETV